MDAVDAALPVLMELHKIVISDMQDQQFIVLREVDGDRTFPIVIHTEQANAIDRRLRGETPPRPFTHDLLANVIEKLSARLDRIEITDLRSGTFFARLKLKQGDGSVDIDSRPSDAIALGITTGVPIYVARQVLDEVCN